MGPPRRKRKPVSGKSNAASSSKSKSSKESKRIAEEYTGSGERTGKSLVARYNYAITYKAVPPATLSEARQREHDTTANVLRLGRSRDDEYLEGTSIPQSSRQKPNTDYKTTVNNAGTFHDSNLSHINQGGNSTVNQGRIVVGGNMVQYVNDNGLSGAVPARLKPFILDYTPI